MSLVDDNCPSHRGVYRNDFTLPSPQTSPGMSDILIALRSAEPVSGLDRNRIRRGDRSLMGNPAYFHPGDTIFPYFEFASDRLTLNVSKEYEYTILVSLYPITESLRDTHVEYGKEIDVIRDSIPGQVVSSQPSKLWSDKGQSLIFSSSYRTGLDRENFHRRLVIPEKTSKGRYALVASVQDAHSRRYLTSWREISIKK